MNLKDTQPARTDNINAIVEYFKDGIKPSAEKIGIELEHTLVRDNKDAVSYYDADGQKNILEKLSGDYTDEIISSDGNLIGLIREREAITLEPGAQMEISAGPFDSLADAKQAVYDFESRLESVTKPRGIKVLTTGYHPYAKASDLKIIPKRRYKFMDEYFSRISSFGTYMMRASASCQVSIDYTSVSDCLRKLRLTNICVPLFSLICDNSPIFEGKPRPHKLMRTEIWNKCDPDRCTLVPNVMKPDFTLVNYAEYILDTPAVVAIVNGKDEYSEKTFGEIFCEDAMSEFDIEHALSMFFTDVRLKKYIEIRPADAMPPDYSLAYAALIKGLFLNDNSLDALDKLFGNVDAQNVVDAKTSLMASGYSADVYGQNAAELVDALVEVAKSGLSEADYVFLQPLCELTSKRLTLADIR